MNYLLFTAAFNRIVENVYACPNETWMQPALDVFYLTPLLETALSYYICLHVIWDKIRFYFFQFDFKLSENSMCIAKVHWWLFQCKSRTFSVCFSILRKDVLIIPSMGIRITNDSFWEACDNAFSKHLQFNIIYK